MKRNNFTVMLVDDNAENLSRMVGEVRDHGYKVISAEDGLQALTLYISKSSDIVVTGIHMPKMHGLKLLRAMRRLNPNIPVVLITGFAHFKKFFPEIVARADGFFEKPLDMGELLNRIDELLGFPVDSGRTT